MSYIIVKNAGSAWQHYFMEDPKQGKVHITYSASDTHTGMVLGIKEKYDDKAEAEIDCKRLNEANPCGDYAVCDLLPGY